MDGPSVRITLLGEEERDSVGFFVACSNDGLDMGELVGLIELGVAFGPLVVGLIVKGGSGMLKSGGLGSGGGGCSSGRFYLYVLFSFE